MQITETTARGQPFKVFAADSVQDMVDWATVAKLREYEARADWAGGSFHQAIELAAGRAQSPYLSEVDALLRKVDTEFRDRERTSWSADISGAYPIVPEFLQGIPECMRHRRGQEDEVAPIRLIVSTWASSAIPAETLRKRGAAIAALAMRLSEERPVELWALNEAGSERKGYPHQMWMVRVSTSPINANEVATVFATPFIKRQILVNLRMVFQEKNCLGTYPVVNKQEKDDCMRLVREVLGLSDADIVFPPLTNSDKLDDITADPAAWVNSMLDAQRKLHD